MEKEFYAYYSKNWPWIAFLLYKASFHFVFKTQVGIMNSQVENKAIRFIESSKEGQGHKIQVCDNYKFQMNSKKFNLFLLWSS